MAYDLEEQEQLAEMRAWWTKYGNLILTLLTVAMLAFAAFNVWRWYQRDQAEKAAGIYGQLEQAVRASDAAKAWTLAASLTENFGGTIYAPMAALQAAKLAADAGQPAKARESLSWVIEKSGHEELTWIARIRLAGVLLDEKQFDQALQVLSVEVPPQQITAVFDRRGDILLGQGKNAEARAAYTEALAKADAQHPLRAIIQLKLDSVPASAT